MLLVLSLFPLSWLWPFRERQRHHSEPLWVSFFLCLLPVVAWVGWRRNGSRSRISSRQLRRTSLSLFSVVGWVGWWRSSQRCLGCAAHQRSVRGSSEGQHLFLPLDILFPLSSSCLVASFMLSDRLTKKRSVLRPWLYNASRFNSRQRKVRTRRTEAHQTAPLSDQDNNRKTGGKPEKTWGGCWPRCCVSRPVKKQSGLRRRLCSASRLDSRQIKVRSRIWRSQEWGKYRTVPPCFFRSRCQYGFVVCAGDPSSLSVLLSHISSLTLSASSFLFLPLSVPFTPSSLCFYWTCFLSSFFIFLVFAHVGDPSSLSVLWTQLTAAQSALQTARDALTAHRAMLLSREEQKRKEVRDQHQQELMSFNHCTGFLFSSFFHDDLLLSRGKSKQKEVRDQEENRYQ